MELGEINKPLLVFGGPYSNLHATQSMFGYCINNHYASNQIICTGDIVAYCAYPEQTVSQIKNSGIYCIAGNVEQQLANELDDCGCNFVEGSVCDQLSKSWYQYANESVSQSSRDWMKSLPDFIRFTIGPYTITVVHGAWSETSRFIYASTPWHEKEKELALSESDIIIAGHAGIPFIEQHGQQAWLNAGVIGMPANDGTSHGWFMTLTPAKDELVIATHALHYDAKSAANALRENGLAKEYADTLETGIWPSNDILPEAERKNQGRPVKPISLTLSL